MSIDEQAAAQLRKPFPKNVIGTLPKGGANLDYVGHAATTDRLLQVDPEWSWEPMATDEHGLPLLDRSGNLWIRLTICGHTRIGVGDGKSAKECIGDAIRNAAMRFGVALDLWSKDELEQTSGEGAARLRSQLAAAPPPRPAPLADAAPEEDEPPLPVAPPEDASVTKLQLAKIGACMGDLGLKDRTVALSYVRDAIGRKDIESRNDLTKTEARKLIDQLEADLQHQKKEQPA